MDLQILNKEQRGAVEDTEGALLVTAGAGSGKTRVLTYRIAHLIENCGVKPWNILAVTFTNKAAKEMHERLGNLLPEDVQTGSVWATTFHSMCVRMLRKYAESIGYKQNFSIYGEAEKDRLIKRVLKEMQSSTDECKEISSNISDAKSKGLTPDAYYKENDFRENSGLVHEVFSKYELEMKKSNAFDFDDLLLKALELLDTSELACNFYQDKFRYVHVDEFQDTNDVQYRIIKKLAQKHGNIMCVGDEDQSIYSWRGASAGVVRTFIKDFNAKSYKLEQNYRSTKKILALANKVILNNEDRIEKNLWTENVEGADVETYVAQSEAEEAEYVVRNILRLKKEVDVTSRSKPYDFSDFAILVRVNAITRSFEEKCIQYGIPYKITGGFKFYERKEIKDILAYLRIATNPEDSEAIVRVINFPKRGIGDAAVAQLLNYSAITGKTLYDSIVTASENEDLPKALCKKIAPFAAVLHCIQKAIQELDVCELTRYLVKLLDLKTVYQEDTEENANRKLNIKELIHSMEMYVKQNPESTVLEYLQNVSLYSDTDDIDMNASCINIATVHGAKGLEFGCVFVVGLEENIFPISRSLDNKENMEEERRLLYVAITRAQERLFLSMAATRFLYGQRKPSLPSRFLEEMGYAVAKPTPRVQEAYGGGGYGGGYGYKKSHHAQNTTNTGSMGAKSSTMSGITRHLPAKNTDIELSNFKTGMRVRHKKFGIGVIAEVTGSKENCYAQIEFEVAGRLHLSLNYAPLEIVDGESI